MNPTHYHEIIPSDLVGTRWVVALDRTTMWAHFKRRQNPQARNNGDLIMFIPDGIFVGLMIGDRASRFG